MARSNLADVAKAFIAKGQFAYAFGTAVLFALVMICVALASTVGISKLPEVVSSIRGKPPPTLRDRR